MKTKEDEGQFSDDPSVGQGDDSSVHESEEETETSMNDVELILQWIGFKERARAQLLNEFSTFEDIQELKEKDISDLSDNYSKRRKPDKIQFGIARTKRLKALIHWVQDFERVSMQPTIHGYTQEAFITELQVAAKRSTIRKQEADRSDTISREAAPGKLKDERKWNDWISGFKNMLSALFGVTGIPLSYVIRDNDLPDHKAEHDTFMQKCIACAPLEGVAFEADARQVHHLVTACVQGESSEQWIKTIKKFQNGRKDVKALSAHYQGEGNTSRRIAEAERLRETLHYKSERALPFATFLAKVQLMFNIFAENNEPYNEAMKVRALFDKVQHPQLASAVSALKVQNTLDPATVSFTSASNHLAAQVSQLAEYTASKRNISAVGAGGENIYRGGKIHTGHYQNWKELSQDDRNKVIAERKRLGVQGPGRKGGGRQPAAKQKRKYEAAVKELETAQRTIASLKKAAETKGKGGAADSDNDNDEDDPGENAGNSFGGRKERKKNK